MGYNSLANYYIEKKIGRGQFSEVYRAKYLMDNTPVALKKVQVSKLFDLIHHLFIFWGYVKYPFKSLCRFKS